MRPLKSTLGAAVAVVLASVSAAAQTTTGAITGRVRDSQGLSVPGVTVEVEGSNLQGIVTVFTSENGDYIVPLLPPGTYTVTLQLTGFERQQKTVSVASTQTVPLDVIVGPAARSETVNVVGRAADVLTQTTQVATNFKQDLIATLPTNRDINAILLLAPSVHPSGPAGAYTIAGSMSFESLYMVNGVTINENLRGQPNTLYIEDAIQETTVATDGVSAEFGRFSGGVVNVITKSGGNLFSGSFRDSLNNDNWRALVTGDAAHPFPPAGTTGADNRINRIVPEYEGVFGGPIIKNELSFFSAVRVQNQSSDMQTVAPLNIPYTAEDNTQRYEGKVTYSLNSSHRFEGDYIKVAETQVNGTFNTATSMDLNSLYTRELPQDLFTIGYSGILTPQFFLEARFSDRRYSFIGSGAQSTDKIDGTLLIDRENGNLRYWSPTFCGVCGPEKRDNNDAFLKGTYFTSTQGSGSHNMTFGFDTFDDERFDNNHQSGSDYRILGTTTIIRDGTIYPQWNPGSTFLQYDPIALPSLGNQFRTDSLFYNDNWRYNNLVTLNLGARWDKNHGVDSAGNLVAKDSAFSPRVGVVWNPKGDGTWSVSASVGKYVDSLNNGIADSASAAGNVSVYEWAYQGAAINPDSSAPTSALTPSASAITQVFNWCNPNPQSGLCMNSMPFEAAASGVSVKIPNGLSSPYVLAYAAGISRQFGSRAVVRADYSYRDYRDFYSARIDTSTGTVTDPLGGQKDDLTIVENTNDLMRRYSGVTVSTTYRASARTDIGGNYTLSRLWGNFDGENSSSGPLTTDAFQYPEYKQLSWYAPVGDLSADQRHRASMWINYGVPRFTGMTLSLLQGLASGLPYGAVGTVNPSSYVTNPGYATPPTIENYYFTARDAFRTDWSRRTDLAASYAHPVRAGKRKVELFTQAQVLNVFNEQDLCGCGATVFSNGGAVSLTTIGQSVLTASNTASLAPFNPLTTKPVLGTNWTYGTNFGAPLNRFAFTAPREFRMTFGLRF